MKNSLFLLLFLLLTTSYAQREPNNPSPVSKVNKWYSQAVETIFEKDRYGVWDTASFYMLVDRMLEKDPKFVDAYVLKAQVDEMRGDLEASIEAMNSALKINPHPGFSDYDYFFLASMEIELGRYADALKNITVYLKNPKMDQRNAPASHKIRRDAAYALEHLKDSMQLNIINLGPGINTGYAEYFPTLTIDDKTMLFTRALPKDPRYAAQLGDYDNIQEDFFVSEFIDGQWTQAKRFSDNVNSPENNEGAPSLAPDGRSIVFVACDHPVMGYGKKRSGLGSCDLFISFKIGKEWSYAYNMGQNINSPVWDSQPSVSSDGKTLYFVRRVDPKGEGFERDQDIFFSELQSDGSWSRAKPLSNVINTPYREASVFIHPDGQTLYFASEGHAGFGGLDIFMSKKQKDGTWSEPKNLGYPINTFNDENSLLVAASGDIAFFASDRPGGYGQLDLYGFMLPPEIQARRTLFAQGIVYDEDTRAPLDAYFEVRTLEDDLLVQSWSDEITGEFLIALPVGQDYIVTAEKKGYYYYSNRFYLPEEQKSGFAVEIPLSPQKLGDSILLENIFFDLAKSTLRPESFVELNKLYLQLKYHPKMKIAIQGHTDSRGKASDNQMLSENRAKAVYDYLISKGINADRLSFKGFGSTHPVNTDTAISSMKTEEEKEAAHQENRRTEYVIIGL